MKNLIFIVTILVAFSFSACGQKENVPAKVKTSFAQKFPGATKVRWDKENANEWEAEFKLGGKSYSANFSTDGIWMETEHEIKKSEIPDAVQKTLNNVFVFGGFDIENVELSETPAGKAYEFELEKDEKSIDVTLSPEGHILKKDTRVEEDED